MRRASGTGVRSLARAQMFWALALAGCIPFVRSKPEPPRTPAVVQRFIAETQALGGVPASPPLDGVTHSLARAVEGLPWSPNSRSLSEQIHAEARKMAHGTEALDDPAQLAPARRSLMLALQAVEAMNQPAGERDNRRRVIDDARRATDALGAPLEASRAPLANDAQREAARSHEPAPSGPRDRLIAAYRAVARVLSLVTGGEDSVAAGSALSALVSRFATEDADQARRTGSQAIYAMADAFASLPSVPSKVKHLADELRERADSLARAGSLDYAAQLKGALSLAADALSLVDKSVGKSSGRRAPSALAPLTSEAQMAIDSIISERPFELQRPAAQDALRLVTDGITVAAGR